jgi:hypothetical protein
MINTVQKEKQSRLKSKNVLTKTLINIFQKILSLFFQEQRKKITLHVIHRNNNNINERSVIRTTRITEERKNRKNSNRYT